MPCVNGIPRLEVTLLKMEREASGRYSVRQPVESRGALAAARANDLPVIAVATGHYSFDELAELEPEACATSLADLLASTQGGN